MFDESSMGHSHFECETAFCRRNETVERYQPKCNGKAGKKERKV